MAKKQYNRILLGKGSKFAKTCRQEGYIGGEFAVTQDLTEYLSDNCTEFNKKVIPLWLALFPEKSKQSASNVCGATWTIVQGLRIGDTVLCPSGEGYFYVGTIIGDYYYVPGTDLPHRRKVEWIDKVIQKKDTSVKFQHSVRSISTCCNITKYAEEIERLLNVATAVKPAVTKVIEPEPVKPFEERQLHKLFCNYLRSRNIYAKTIYHEKSSTKTDSTQKWVHPDIIGVQFEDFSNEATLTLLKATDPRKSVHIYSYEMKRRVENDSQLKQYYFQALSNSSWANFGYLVAFEIADGLEEEMERLNNAFGIGIILLQATDATVLYPAREKSLDYNTVEKLNNINPDFCKFMNKLGKALLASKDYSEVARKDLYAICDEVFNKDDEIETYCKKYNIPF